MSLLNNRYVAILELRSFERRYCPIMSLLEEAFEDGMRI